MQIHTRSMLVAPFLALVLGAGVACEAAAQPTNPVPSPSRAGAEPTTISAVGSGSVSVKPDRATVVLGVEVQAEKSDLAQAQCNQRMAKILAALRGPALGDPVIQTSTINLQPVVSDAYDPRKGEPKITGFRASSTISVRTGELAAAGRIIDAAVAGGANRIDSVSFDLKDDAKARAEALASATKQAKAQAEVIASALGLKIGRVVQAQTGGGQVPVRMQHFAAMKASDSASTPLEAGEVTISAEATVTFEGN